MRDEGLQNGLRQAIRDICDVLAIVPLPSQLATLDGLGVEALEALRDRIKRERRW